MALLRTGCCRSSFASLTLIGTRTAQRKSENEGKRSRMLSSTPTTSRDRYGHGQRHDGFPGGETCSTITGRSGPQQSGSCFSFRWSGWKVRPTSFHASYLTKHSTQRSLRLCVFARGLICERPFSPRRKGGSRGDAKNAKRNDRVGRFRETTGPKQHHRR